MPRQVVILDTNFLLIPAQFGIDVFTEIPKICEGRPKLAIFDKSIDELKAIIRKEKGKPKKEAELTLKLINSLLKNNKLNIIPAKIAYIDEEILNKANKNTIIATQDLELRKKLRKKGVKTIIMRQKKYLKIEG